MREERDEKGVAGAAWSKEALSFATSANLRFPGEVTAEVRGVLNGDSGWKLGCEMKLSVWLEESVLKSSSFSSESSFQPKLSDASEIILALAVLGGDLKLRCGVLMNLRSVCGVSSPLFIRPGVRRCGVSEVGSGSDRELARTVACSRIVASSAHRKKLHLRCGGCAQVQTISYVSHYSIKMFSKHHPESPGSKIRHTPFAEVRSLLLSFATDGNWPIWAVTTPKTIFEEAAMQTRGTCWRTWVFLRGGHFQPVNSFSPDV